MAAGPLVAYLPDDTLALMIYWSSREADAITPGNPKCKDRFDFALPHFVAYDAAIRALLLPGGRYLNSLDTGGDSKMLGELSIKKGSSGGSSSLSGGVDATTLNELKDIRDKWKDVVAAGGCITPGQGFGFMGAMRGLYDPARRPAGRLWEDPDCIHYNQPTVNTKIRRRGRRMYRHGHLNGYYGTRRGRYYDRDFSTRNSPYDYVVS
jgi:hypothetical protein